MAKVQISSRNFIDAATTSLSGGSWAAPLSNLKNRRLSATARSTDGNPTSTLIDIDLGANPEPANIFAIIRPNWTSLQDAWRLTAGTSRGSSNRYDSGWQTGFPRVYTLADRPFETENWWFGALSSWELEAYPKDVMWPLPSMITARWWRLEIDMQAAPYVEIGRLWLGQSWRPMRNMDRDRLQYEDLSETQQSLGGVQFFDVRPKRRVYSFSLPNLTEEEGYGDALDLQRRVGITGDVIVLPDADDTVRGHKRNFYGRLRQLDALERAGQRFGLASTSYTIEELL